ncbi:MAG TPA: 5'-methylthioadenosine/S-adenosylhomocysteine nucleosidase [Candidatus Dormibacteraeota bacterium]|nr:5'-methylthioadenosine/S-adenosylhomocysteine nucleosidase [Candidatus Dormibacteraeota bacterium]
MPDQRPVAVIAALAQEAHSLVRRMPRSESVGPRLQIWEGNGLVVIVAGVGKVAAAMAAQYACDTFKPRSMVSIGLASGLESRTRPGSVIVASGAVQHDMDGRPLTEARGVIPGLGISIIPAHPAVTEMLLRAARYRSEDARAGLVLTGDQIVTSSAVRDALRREFPDAACIDMETASVAQVAHQNSVPWSALRVTSGSADDTFDLKGVIGFGVDTAANLFESIIQTVVDEL